MSASAMVVMSMPAIAQDEEVEEVVVTGSRLNTNSNLQAPNPVLQISSEEIDSRGTVRVEDLTNVLPQVFAGQASEVSNGATGTATLNLRGLGSIRTLVLIDGRRLPFGSSTSSSADLNLIPTQMIERVEIVTGGASAVYGSDAIGGVANFILRKDFEGVEFESQGGFYQAGNNSDTFRTVLEVSGQPVPDSTIDGREIFGSMILGANTPDDRGNVTVFINYQSLNEITQDNRVESACALSQAADGPTSFNNLTCAGSANFRLFGGPGGFFFQEESGEIVPFAGGAAQTYNYGPLNYFQRPVERFQIYTRAHYDLTDNIEVFADLSYVNNASDAQIAPSASFGIGAYSINCDNPLIQGTPGTDLATGVFGCTPDQIANGEDVTGITASHRNVEGGPRNSNIDLTTWRTVGGVRGTFLDNFDFEAFGQFARTLQTRIATNDFIVNNLQEAFFAVDDGNGNVVCRSGTPGCVPYNIFQRGPNGESLVSQDSLDFILGPGVVNGESQQIVFGANIQTDLGEYGVQSPLADGGVGILMGVEYREDSLDSNPDAISQLPDGGFTGVGGPTLEVAGEVEVAEFYSEVQIPLVSGAFLAEELTLRSGYRFSEYTNKGNGVASGFDTNSYFASLSWAPHEDFRVRAQYQRAIRAPNVIELFTGQAQGLTSLSQTDGLFDPCSTANPVASFEQCARTGVTADQFGTGQIIDVISGQTGNITGGNPDLAPEVSDTYTLGFVFTPSFIPGFSLAFDYFDIQLDEAISAGIPAQTILDECLATGNPVFCDLIQRDANGTLNSGSTGTGFTQTNLNLASLTTSGFDIQMLYDVDLDLIGLDGWSVTFDYAMTYLIDDSFTSFPGAEEVECAGFFAGSCGTPSAEYRHRMLATWQTPYPLSFTTTWRFFGETDNFTGTEQLASIDNQLERRQYLDLSANYSFGEKLSLRAGILNVTGNEPPVTTALGPPLGNGNTAPTVFDATGRFFFFGATSRF
ncbi:MAG: TonB-dependent receptor [Pseudomonadota bacterium]